MSTQVMALGSFVTNTLVLSCSNARGHVIARQFPWNAAGPRVSLFLTRCAPHFRLFPAWQLSQFLYAVTLVSVTVTSSLPLCITLIGCLGVGWAVQNWAPWALLNTEIAKLHEEQRGYDETEVAAKDDLGSSMPNPKVAQAGLVLG